MSKKDVFGRKEWFHINYCVLVGSILLLQKWGPCVVCLHFADDSTSPWSPQHPWQFCKISQQQIWKFPLQKDNTEWINDNSCVVWISLMVAKMGTICTGLSLFCQRLPSASHLPPILDSSAKFQLFPESCKSQKSANIHHYFGFRLVFVAVVGNAFLNITLAPSLFILSTVSAIEQFFKC